MLNQRRHNLRVLFYGLGEVAVVALSFFAAYAIRLKTSGLWGQQLEPLREVLWLLPAGALAWAVFLWIPSGYDGFRSRNLLAHAATAGLTSLLSVIALFALVTVTKHYTVNRSLIGIYGLTAFLALVVCRTIAAFFLAHYTQKGYDRHYVVIGGTHPDAVSLAEFLESIPGAVFQVRGFVSEESAPPGTAVGRWTLLGTYADLPELASRMPVDEVYLLPGTGPLEKHLDLVRRCEAIGMTVHLRLSSFEKSISRLELVEAAGGDYLRFATAPKGGMGLLAKRVMDVSGALLLLLLLSPLLLVVALLVRLTSRGPSVFRQDRAGMNGRVFTMFKFRTMSQDAEKQRSGLEAKNELDGPVFKIKEDPRITGLGKFLRKTSIDELPQLWNVVKGDMSLVGPRPLPVYEVEKFEPWQRRRMTMRPGLTCIWQVQGRNRVTRFEDWIRMDLEYVDRWSLGLDIKILLQTIPAVLGGRGAY